MDITFFRNKLPVVGEYVDIILTDITNPTVNGVLCTLPFYANANGLILPTEMLKNRREKLTKVFTKGHHMICTVMSVDESRNYIDLSRKRVDDEDNKKHKILFDKMGRISSFMKIIFDFYCDFYNLKMDDMTDETKTNILDASLWNISDDILDEPTDYYNLYEKILCEPKMLFENTTQFLEQPFIDFVVKEINRRTISEPFVVEYCFDIVMVNNEGVNALNNIMVSVFGNYEENTTYNIELFSLPTYKVTFKCDTQQEIEETIQNIENKLTTECEKYGKGVFLSFNTNPKFGKSYNILKQKSIVYSNGNKNINK